MKALLWFESLAGGGHAQIADKMLHSLQQKAEAMGEPLELAVVSSSFDMLESANYANAKRYELPKLYKQDADGQKHWQLDDQRFYFTTEECQNARKEALATVLQEFQPDVIITEQRPFERGNHAAEMDMLENDLEQFGSPALIGLLRDVPLSPNGGCVGGHPDMLVETVNQSYDQILVFSDKEILPISTSLQAEYGQGSDETYGQRMEEAMSKKIQYVGFPVSPPTLSRNENIANEGREVIVSQGGGATPHGFNLLKCSIRAADKSVLKENPWTVFVSPHFSDEQFNELQSLADNSSANISVERNVSSTEFQTRLVNARASLSVAGQNTSFEVMQSEIPAVVAPIAHPRFPQTEQELRSEIFEQHGMLQVINAGDIANPDTMAAKINAATTGTATKNIRDFHINGFENASEQIVELGRHRAKEQSICPKIKAAMDEFHKSGHSPVIRDPATLPKLQNGALDVKLPPR